MMGTKVRLITRILACRYLTVNGLEFSGVAALMTCLQDAVSLLDKASRGRATAPG